MSDKTDAGTSIIDNIDTVFVDKFKKYCDGITELKIAVGYFYLGGFNLVKEKLGKIDDIKLVMGDETDESTERQITLGYEERLTRELHGIDENDEQQIKDLKELHQFISSSKVEIQIYPDRKFHAKAYIFKSNKDDRLNTAIIGSSNFSKRGMLKDQNIELNSIHRDIVSIKILDEWFDNVWAESEDYKKGMLKIIENSQPYIRKISKDEDYLSPIELLKFMIVEFLDGIDVEPGEVLTEFQSIGYTNALVKLDKLGGCIIADSVGLGKTYIGLKLIEQEQMNGKNILLIIPASVKENWNREIESVNKDGIKNFEIDTDKKRLLKMTITELSNIDLRKDADKNKMDMIKKNYQFVVIDEAHRFRNYGSFDSKKYHKNKNYANLNHLKSKDKKYALLTATPLNNSITDLYNLIRIFTSTGGLKNCVPPLNLDSFVEYQTVQKKIGNEKKKEEPNSRQIGLLENELVGHLSEIKRIMEEVMILRTRTEISRRYPNLEIGGRRVQFQIPMIKPQKYTAGEKYTPLFEGLSELLTDLNLPHISLTNDSGGENLSGLYRILLFKRMESSIYSFTNSLERLLKKENEFLEEIEEYGWEKVRSRKRRPVDDAAEVGDDDDLVEFMPDYEEDKDEASEKNTDGRITDLIKEDIELIEDFIDRNISKIRSNELDKSYVFFDPKINKLMEIVKDNNTQKILIFSQYVDTVKYLYENLKPVTDSLNKTLDCVTGSNDTDPIGSNRKTAEKIRLFAPIANEYKIDDKEQGIDVLIATDSLSEGVNLQDCSLIVNYDLPWNPTRIIQRVGRVDRIGSESQTTIFNILPDEQLDMFLELVSKLEGKIKKIGEIIGKENYILTEDEEINPYTIGEKIKRLKTTDDFSTYEEIGTNRLLNGIRNDDHAIKLLKIRYLAKELGVDNKTTRRNFRREMYSLIKKDAAKGLFAMFRIYDSAQSDQRNKLRNITIKYDFETGNYEEVGIDCLGLHEFNSGVSKSSHGNSHNLDEIRKNLTCYFKDNHYSEIKAGFRKTNMRLSEQTHQLQQCFIDRLNKMTKNTKILPNVENQENRDRALNLYNVYLGIKMTEEDVGEFSALYLKGVKPTNDQKTIILGWSDIEFIEKLDTYYDEHVKNNPNHPELRDSENIKFKLVCWGAFV